MNPKYGEGPRAEREPDLAETQDAPAAEDRRVVAPGDAGTADAPPGDTAAGETEPGVSGPMLPGGYRLDRRIGLGGMGEVWRGWCTKLHRPVAIKLVRYDVRSRVQAARFEREARALAALRHPAVVDVHDIGRDPNGRPFIVMELLEGEDLASYLYEHGPLAAAEAVDLLLPVLEALSLAHDRGIVHRDLKPDNVFLTRDDRGRRVAKLLDFGVAQVESGDRLTFGLVGTPEFMAPEQLRLDADVDGRADQWAACITLYMALVGEPPFVHESVGELSRSILGAPLPFPLERPLDPALFRILARGTRKAPEERFENVRALAEALRGWRAQQETGAATGAGARPLAAAADSEPPAKPDDPEGGPPVALDAAIRAALGER